MRGAQLLPAVLSPVASELSGRELQTGFAVGLSGPRSRESCCVRCIRAERGAGSQSSTKSCDADVLTNDGSNNLKITRTLAIAATAAALVATSGCTGAADEAPTAEPGAYIVDPGAEQITEENAAYLTELYEAAKEEGEVVVYTAAGTEMEGTFALFQEMFPGVKLTSANLLGAPLVQALAAEAASGNYVADVLQNPDAQNYITSEASGDYSEPYEVRTLKVPEILTGSKESIIDPEHRFSTPFLAFFGLGSFLPRVAEAGGVPESFADLADPKYRGLIGMGDPTAPGPQQFGLLYLLESGGLDEESLNGLAANAVVKGDYGQAIGGLVQGEFAFMPGAPSSSVVVAAEGGAPVEFSVFKSDNPLVTHKHVLLKGAPHPNAAKLYLEFLNLFSAQKSLAAAAFMPLNEEASDPEAPWTSLEASGTTEIVSYKLIDASRAELLPMIDRAFGR